MKKNLSVALLSIAVALFGLVSFAGDALAGATIVIQNNDGAGEGFNDPTPWTPTGGNPATTLGQARLNAFQYAADLWASCLNSNITIVVAAQMNVQFCDATSAVLGSAGAQTVHGNFANAPVMWTWYPQALANSLANSDLDPATPDIGATFNSALNGNPGCLGGIGWYYGYDSSPPGNDIDFVTVVMHEIGHGLGFQTFVNLATGAKFNTYDDTYMLNLEQLGAVPPDYPSMSNAQRVTASTSDPNLVWVGPSVTAEHPNVPITAGTNGGYLRNHGPAVQAPGSSVSHWSNQVSPNEVMEPFYGGPNHDPSLALFLMEDIGWSLDQACVCAATPTTLASNVYTSVTTSWPLWTIRLPLENTGSFDAQNVVGTITNWPAWLTIVDGTCNYGTIIAGTTENGSPDSYQLNINGWPYAHNPFVITVDFLWEDDCGNQTRVQEDVTLDPSQFFAVGTEGVAAYNSLGQNVPNPFNPTTDLSYQIKGDELVTLAIYDVSGKRVRTLVNKQQTAGGYTATWDGRDDTGALVSSGVYFYRITAGEFTQTRRMVLLK